MEGVQFAGRNFHSDDTLTDFFIPRLVIHDQIEDQKFVVEINASFDALLIKRLQNHVTGAIRRVTGTMNRSLTEFSGVPTESADPVKR